MSDKRPSFLRRQLLIDRTIQLPLLFYYVCSTIIGILAVAASSVAITMFVTFESFQQWGPVVLVLTLLISFGIFVYCGLYITNKVAGPVFRLTNHLKDIADGKVPEKMIGRPDDFTGNLVAEYNRMVETLTNNKTKRAP